MKHKAVRVDNLMYDGCEAHWRCVHCGECVPFHCYSKYQFEQKECPASRPYEYTERTTPKRKFKLKKGGKIL